MPIFMSKMAICGYIRTQKIILLDLTILITYSVCIGKKRIDSLWYYLAMKMYKIFLLDTLNQPLIRNKDLMVVFIIL